MAVEKAQGWVRFDQRQKFCRVGLIKTDQCPVWISRVNGRQRNLRQVGVLPVTNGKRLGKGRKISAPASAPNPLAARRGNRLAAVQATLS